MKHETATDGLVMLTFFNSQNLEYSSEVVKFQEISVSGLCVKNGSIAPQPPVNVSGCESLFSGACSFNLNYTLRNFFFSFIQRNKKGVWTLTSSSLLQSCSRSVSPSNITDNIDILQDIHQDLPQYIFPFQSVYCPLAGGKPTISNSPSLFSFFILGHGYLFLNLWDTTFAFSYVSINILNKWQYTVYLTLLNRWERRLSQLQILFKQNVNQIRLR